MHGMLFQDKTDKNLWPPYFERSGAGTDIAGEREALDDVCRLIYL